MSYGSLVSITVLVCVCVCHLLQYYKRRKKYLCHDENEECRDGDLVRIKECRPLSKQKHFTVEEIIERAEQYTDPTSGKTFTKSVS